VDAVLGIGGCWRTLNEGETMKPISVFLIFALSLVTWTFTRPFYMYVWRTDVTVQWYQYFGTGFMFGVIVASFWVFCLIEIVIPDVKRRIEK
jgi:hypothetical protein